MTMTSVYSFVPRYRLSGRYVIESRIRNGRKRRGMASFTEGAAIEICAKENLNTYGGVFWPSAEVEAVALDRRRGLNGAPVYKR